MHNRFKQLLLNVQKHVYEIAGMVGEFLREHESTNRKAAR